MNNNYAVFWVLVIPIAISIPIVVWSLRYAQKRNQEFAQISQQMGFRFLGNTWRGPVLSPLHKTCVIQRMRGSFSNVMIGTVGGLDVTLFDFTYRMGKSSVTLTMVAFVHDRQVPPFELRSESIFDKIGEAFVHNDVDFDSNPEFSRRYYLRSPDEAHVRTLFGTGFWHISSNSHPISNGTWRHRLIPWSCIATGNS